MISANEKKALIVIAIIAAIATIYWYYDKHSKGEAAEPEKTGATLPVNPFIANPVALLNQRQNVPTNTLQATPVRPVGAPLTGIIMDDNGQLQLVPVPAGRGYSGGFNITPQGNPATAAIDTALSYNTPGFNNP